MSDASSIQPRASSDGHDAPDGDEAHHGHPRLAHHFDSLQQQYASAKLGMWVFLGTEILMFGGLFCAYGVYRYSHPEVFEFAHLALDPVLGGINTAVLIASSLTMALAVRYSQLGRNSVVALCLVLTLFGALGFMVIKGIEYKSKWEHHLFPGKMNIYHATYAGELAKPELLSHGVSDLHPTTAPVAGPTTQQINLYVDPLAGTADEPKIKPPFVNPAGLGRPREPAPEHRVLRRSELTELDQQRISTFFSIYFFMTGLHGLHVLIGMGLISWILVRALRGEFDAQYFTPVDMVGLYWHLVDLIWIFLFPLLYLIH